MKKDKKNKKTDNICEKELCPAIKWKQNWEGCLALDFYWIPHQGKFMDHHIKELQKARERMDPLLKKAAQIEARKMFAQMARNSQDKFAPPGPDSPLWSGAVYDKSSGF